MYVRYIPLNGIYLTFLHISYIALEPLEFCNGFNYRVWNKYLSYSNHKNNQKDIHWKFCQFLFEIILFSGFPVFPFCVYQTFFFSFPSVLCISLFFPKPATCSQLDPPERHSSNLPPLCLSFDLLSGFVMFVLPFYTPSMVLDIITLLNIILSLWFLLLTAFRCSFTVINTESPWNSETVVKASWCGDAFLQQGKRSWWTELNIGQCCKKSNKPKCAGRATMEWFRLKHILELEVTQ